MSAGLISLLNGCLKHFFTKGVERLWENRDNVSVYLKTLFLPKYRNARIRFSIAYLFRIKIPGSNSYLLVSNRRINNQFQPPGGCYKRYGDDKLFESWGYIPDNYANGLGTDNKSENDLRFTVIGKNVIKVIKWFEEAKEREVCANREFKEELIYTDILDKEIFKDFRYKQIKRISGRLRWSQFHNCYEIKIFDVLELLPSEKQREYLTSLKQYAPLNSKKGYAIAEFEDIKSERLMEKGLQIARIGEHTKLLFN